MGPIGVYRRTRNLASASFRGATGRRGSFDPAHQCLSAPSRPGMHDRVIATRRDAHQTADASPETPHEATRPGLAVAVLLALGFATLFAGLGGYPLFDPSEGRHAAVAREMADRGQWLVPVLYEEPYYDKPAPF